ncbi:MAG: hypothetical protein JRC90_09585 [Deltaproteobacteria bacterium]|nr:hypothetical protein [Deltaproteobacteria bacterium]
MKKILIVLIIGCGFVFGALNYHFILTDKSIKVLKKVDLTFDNTFVDARGAKKIKLYFNPALVKAGVKDLLKDVGK